MVDQAPPSPPSISLPGALASFRGKLAELRGSRRIDALLAEDDAPAVVAALAPSEIYELVHEVGFEDAGELIALATPEQLQGCFDFESWDKDEFLPAAFLPWLAVLLDAGFEKVGEVWSGLDAEARMLFLQRHVRVYDVTLGEGPDEDNEAPMMTTSDGFFLLELFGDSETQRMVMSLVEDLYRADANLARHTIQGARSEPAAELEESSYRWRAGRLADLGYVDFHDALELFRPLELEQLKLDEREASSPQDASPAAAPLAVAKEVLDRPFLARALAEIDDAAELARIEGAILYLVNRVLAAARAKPGQQEVVQRAAQYASATISLGLEAAARGDASRAAAILRSTAMPRLFRVGYTLGLRLAKLALALAPRAATAESPARDVLGALASPRPLWSRAADQPPAPGVRPFDSLADIKRSTEVLSALTVRLALVESLGVDLLAMARAPEPRPTLETFLRTALLRAMATGRWRGGAIPAAELAEVRRRAFNDAGSLTAAARRRAHETVAQSLGAEQLLAGAATLPTIVDELLGQLEATLGDIADAVIDPRFVDGILIEA